MKRILVLLSMISAVLMLTACTSGTPTKTSDRIAAPTPPSTSALPVTKVVAAPLASVLKVPTDLVGKTIGNAKTELGNVGFTHVVIAGGSGITDTAKVTDVSNPGESVSPDSKIVLTGATSTPSTSSACQQDSTKCYLEGRRCETGSCVNAARGLSPNDVKRQTDEWLSHHPNYCAAGTTGGVARCGNNTDATTDSDPNSRDANGETKAEYCARIGYPLSTCPAG